MNAVARLRPDEAIAAHGPEVVLQAAMHAAWRAGDLSYRFSEVQLRARALVYEHAARTLLWLTCRRFGKTRSACGISTEKALAYPGMRIPYAASTGQQVRDFVEPHMFAISAEAPPELAPELLDGEWVFPPLQWHDAAGNPVRTRDDGGVELGRFKGTRALERLRSSRIVPKGCEDERKANLLRGPGTGFAVVDEARDIDIVTYVLRDVIGPMMWEARSVWGAALRPKILVPSTPPREEDHPHAEMIEEARERGRLFEADVYVCDHLSGQDIAEAIEEAGGEDTTTWQREGLAEIVVDPARVVVPEWSELGEKLTVKHERPKHFIPCVIGDGGFVDQAVILFGYHDFRADLDVVERELVFQRTRSDAIDARCAEIEAELWPGRKVVHRYIDAPPITRADMSSADMQDEDDETKRFWMPVRKDEKQAGVNELRVRVKRERLRIDPSCETTLRHVKNGRWDNTRRDFVRVRDSAGEVMHHYDGLAALTYFVRDLDRRTNPYPRLAEGVSEDDHFIHPRVALEQKRRREMFIPKALRRRLR